MTCCKCNRTGRCRSCSCVKRGFPCQGCQPMRLGNCENANPSQTPSTSEEPVTLTSNLTQSSEYRSTDSYLVESPEDSIDTAIISQPPITSLSSSDSATVDPILPPFVAAADPVFVWGECDATQLTDDLNAAYAEAIHWKMNLFKLPYGKTGKSFVSELAKLFEAFATGSALESIALKAATIMPILLLQRPARKMRSKDLNSCLERRLTTWREGDMKELLREGRTIQQRLPKITSFTKNDRFARSFANLMFQGKVGPALRLLSDQMKNGTLHLDDTIDTAKGKKTVRDILSDKHPPGQPPQPDAIIADTVPPNIHPIVFDALDADAIKSAACHTNGAAGPSGLDALRWRRLCTSFKSASSELCQSLAKTAKRFCTELIDPSTTAPLLVCRLIVLDKKPGMRPIGIGDVARRIIAKLYCISPNKTYKRPLDQCNSVLDRYLASRQLSTPSITSSIIKILRPPF